MTEKLIEAEIRRYVKNGGGLVVKLHGNATQGKTTLDIIGHYKQKPLVVEVKQPGATPTPYQEYMLEAFRKGGYVAIWADSLTMFVHKFAKAVRDATKIDTK